MSGMRPLAAVLALAVLAAPAAAHEVKQGDITVDHPLLRASLGAVPNTAGYMVVRNGGRTADRLLSASCACAAKVSLHTHVSEGRVSRMRPVSAVAIPAGGQAAFAPGGHHLMLTGLKRRAEAGTVQSLTLRFERAGTVSVPFLVTARVEQELAARGEHAGHGSH